MLPPAAVFYVKWKKIYNFIQTMSLNLYLQVSPKWLLDVYPENPLMHENICHLTWVGEGQKEEVQFWDVQCNIFCEFLYRVFHDFRA